MSLMRVRFENGFPGMTDIGGFGQGIWPCHRKQMATVALRWISWKSRRGEFGAIDANMGGIDRNSWLMGNIISVLPLRELVSPWKRIVACPGSFQANNGRLWLRKTLKPSLHKATEFQDFS